VHRSRLSLGLFAFALVLFSRAGIASACTCTEPSLKEAAVQAETVFVGAVSDLGLDYAKHERITGFTVQRVFKGAAPERLRVVSALDEAACGYSFARGTVYLVFTRNIAGRAFTWLCSGTRALATGQKAPPELGSGSAPAAPAH
jgi:hypothetical protein